MHALEDRSDRMVDFQVPWRKTQGDLRFVHGLVQPASGCERASQAVMPAREIRRSGKGIPVFILGFLEKSR